MSQYKVISCPYFPVFSTNTEKYGPEITPYLDTFHAVVNAWNTAYLISYLEFPFVLIVSSMYKI